LLSSPCPSPRSFVLPGELRNKIYNYIFEDEAIELVHYGHQTPSL
jgi:hypothetical protein